MSSTISREIISIFSPKPAAYDEVEQDFFVKGFASVETIDRTGDLVDPSEFRHKQALATVAVMIDHDYWVDPRGNQITVGKVAELYPAEVVDIGSEEFWGVKSFDGSRENTFPKDSIPNLKPGSRGLFTVIQVTEPEIMDDVRKGKLSAFSWRGFASTEISKDADGKEVRALKDIDLLEISLVHMPMNPDATLIIGKSFNESGLVVYAVELSKTVFPSGDSAKGFLSSHKLSTSIKEDSNCFCAPQCLAVDTTQLVRIGLLKGVDIIAGPAMPAKSLLDNAPKVPANFLSSFKDVLVKDYPMSKVTIEAEEIRVSTAKGAVDGGEFSQDVEEKGVVSPGKSKGEIDNSKVDQGFSTSNMQLRSDAFKAVLEEELPGIVEKAAQTVMAQLSPVLEGIKDAISKSVEAPEAPVAETKTTETLVAEVVETEDEQEGETVEASGMAEDFQTALVQSLNMIVEEVDRLSQRVDSLSDVGNIVQDLRKSVPRQPAREETLAQRNADPNSVFNAHPVLGFNFMGR